MKLVDYVDMFLYFYYKGVIRRSKWQNIKRAVEIKILLENIFIVRLHKSKLVKQIFCKLFNSEQTD